MAAAAPGSTRPARTLPTTSRASPSSSRAERRPATTAMKASMAASAAGSAHAGSAFGIAGIEQAGRPLPGRHLRQVAVDLLGDERHQRVQQRHHRARAARAGCRSPGGARPRRRCRGGSWPPPGTSRTARSRRSGRAPGPRRRTRSSRRGGRPPRLTAARRLKIQRSAGVASSHARRQPAGWAPCSTKREAFQILFAKFRPISMRSALKRTSCTELM